MWASPNGSLNTIDGSNADPVDKGGYIEKTPQTPLFAEEG